MATVTGTLSLSSTDLLSDAISFSTSFTHTTTKTSTGLARETITSTAKGTASGQVLLYTADDYAAIAYLYVKNTNATPANKIYIYNDSTTGDPLWMQLAGGDFAFVPMHGDKTLKAYAPNGSDPIIEWMVFGVDQ